MKALTPLLLIALAAVIFFYGISAEYNRMKELREEARLYDEVLARYNDKNALQNRIDQELASIKNSSFLNKIQVALPDGIDNVQLLLEISNLLQRYGSGVDWRNIRLDAVTTGSTPPPTNAGGAAVDVGFKDYKLQFNLVGRYQSVLVFLRVLEHNLRLLDIIGLKLTQTDKALPADAYNFEITLRTYWFNKQK